MSGAPRDRVTALLAVLPPAEQDAVAAWISDPEGRPLERHLGLDRVAHRIAVRDFHLRRAYALMPARLSARGRRLQLVAEIKRFAAAAWPALRRRRAPDPAWSELRRELWLAFKSGGKVPSSPRQIFAIVAAEIAHASCDVDDDENPNRKENG